MDKLYVSANELHRDALILGKHVIESGCRPDVVVTVMRGGAPIGITIHELLRYHGIPADHLAIQTATYSTPDVLQEGISVHGLEHVVRASQHRNVLFVDDVFDRGLTYQAILAGLTDLGCQAQDISLATVYYKPTRNRTTLGPDFYVHTTDKWLVFPHDLVGLTPEEIFAKGEDIARVVCRDFFSR